MPGNWANGRCQRGHDVTDPANVRVFRRRNGIGRECLVCQTMRAAHEPLPTLAAVMFPPRTCEQCGGVYHHKPGTRSRREWARQRYCGERCRLVVFARGRQRRVVGGRAGPVASHGGGRVVSAHTVTWHRLTAAAPHGSDGQDHRKEHHD